jgi:hypothetical protein
MKARLVIMLALILLLALFSLAGLAEAYLGNYTLNWWTVDSGGGTSSEGGYTLNGTLGQPDAGTIARGDGYTLAGGFWHGGAAVTSPLKIYLPQVVRY